MNMNSDYQSIKDSTAITGVILVKSTTTQDELKAMKDKVENGYMIIVPDVDDYGLVSYNTDRHHRIKYVRIKLLNKNSTWCFGLCKYEYIMQPCKPGIYRMKLP